MRCQQDGCDREANARDMCLMHYKRWRRRNPEKIYDWRQSLEERFWSKVQKADGCWLWTGTTIPSGYGTLGVGSRTDGSRGHVYAHVLAYELQVGSVPAGHQVDHLCRNRKCVREDHLEPVLPRDNVLRGRSVVALNARKTHCPKGHPYDTANTLRWGDGHRRCRACRDARRKWQPDADATTTSIEVVRG